MKKHVLIFGLKRTGTTIFWETFRKDKRFLCFDEPFHQNLWADVMQGLNNWKKTADEFLVHADLVKRYWSPILPHDEPIPDLVAHQRFYIQMLLNEASNVCADLVTCSAKLGALRGVAPQALFIHLVRDPRAFVTSHLKPYGKWIHESLEDPDALFAYEGGFDFWQYGKLSSALGRREGTAVERLLHIWKFFVTKAEEQGPDMTIQFENFASSPHKVMSRIFEDLTLPYQAVDYSDIHAPNKPHLYNDPRWRKALHNVGIGKEFLFDFDAPPPEEDGEEETEESEPTGGTSASVTCRKKMISFFVLPDLDNFIDEVIESLAHDYEVKKVITENQNQLKAAIDQTDICWFEWCNEHLIYATRELNLTGKRVIARMHGYEAYGRSVVDVDWRRVDDLIVVTPHILRIFEEKMKFNLSARKTLRVHEIRCGLDPAQYPFKERQKGFNVGFLGFFNPKKNIPALLHIFTLLHKKDPRYRLFMAGTFQDERLGRSVVDYINYNELGDAVNIQSWRKPDEKIEWLDQIDYMLITSIEEGICYAAAEAMLSGIKPVLNACEGLRDHYPKEYLFTLHDEAVEMIMDENYDSAAYRRYITENYSAEDKAEEIKKVIES